MHFVAAVCQDEGAFVHLTMRTPGLKRFAYCTAS